MNNHFLSHKKHNPNTTKSYKILQKLSPKHAAHGVAQSPYPIYRHGKACLSKQPPWRAAGDPRLARGRYRVWATAPAGALRMLFFSTLPSFLLWEIVFFRTFPTNPAKVLGLRHNEEIKSNLVKSSKFQTCSKVDLMNFHYISMNHISYIAYFTMTIITKTNYFAHPKVLISSSFPPTHMPISKSVGVSGLNSQSSSLFSRSYPKSLEKKVTK